tara:strand:- start:690 stop:809 length:120 start_codon:yes stop_codon:yes gene_type:complete
VEVGEEEEVILVVEKVLVERKMALGELKVQVVELLRMDL